MNFSSSPLRCVGDNLFVLRYPLWAPISGRFDHVTQRIRYHVLQQALHVLDMTDPIVWLARPTMYDLIDEIPSACLKVYHIVDEYTTYSRQSTIQRQRLMEAEKKMMARVDAVIVVSEELHRTKRTMHPHVHLVANGVNYQLYDMALHDPKLPDPIVAIKEPRLGYIGLIGDRLDLKMLLNIAQARPQWSLVFLGEVRVEQQAAYWQNLLELPNVHHLNPVEAKEVPHYVKGFQVGLMPYRQNRHARNISPLKMYDYLAAGLPIASLDIPAVEKFNRYIYIAKTPDNYLSAIEQALSESSPDRRQQLRSVAARHSWEARAEEISTLIEFHLTVAAVGYK